ncbi:probable tubulin polyglutamylase TTLL9 isoform X5 [Narcine bancroftii]|uniref:probable tubulin polyglutamylase TTLL9 isoform X5 n=1 Tax=Narcine bancroftii TaxID=1343680 RepID=UPI0038312CC4
MNRSKSIVNKGLFGNLKQREQRNLIRFKCVLTNTILDVLRQRPGWVEVKETVKVNGTFIGVISAGYERTLAICTWMSMFASVTFAITMRILLEIHPLLVSYYLLTRKNFMVKNLKRFRKQLDREQGKLEAAKCDFFPKTFELPVEYHLFVEEFKRNPGITWIMKPVARSQGKGIFLFRKLKDIIDWRKDGTRADDSKDEATVESYVVQRYIENPYLIGERKFDLRVYVLVTSGCKWLMQQLRQYLTAKHGTEAIETLFRDMDNIFIKSLQSVQSLIINDKHCFELYGYDILIDKNLKPWLLEVNASPSLIASSQEDYELKCRLLQDTVNVIDMEGRLSGKEKQVGGFDLMWNDGPVYNEDINFEGGINLIANTHLGCMNDREKQLWHLLKPLTTQK